MTDNIIHATAVRYKDQGLLLRGPSGAGKSDLALRLIREHNAVLVSDDRGELLLKEGRIWIAAPDLLQGLMEVRGIGIVPMPHIPEVALNLVIDLSEKPERLPDPDVFEFKGIQIRRTSLNPFESGVIRKINLALELDAK